MRSSPAYAGLALELPARTLAERATFVLVPLAGACGAWVLWRHGHAVPWAGVPAALAVGVLAMQARLWTRSSPRLRLERRQDGALVLVGLGPVPLVAALGPRTRRLGPSVFLDLRFAICGREHRLSRWLTRFDVPGGTLRRWTVVLPSCGCAARS